jgi:hypothetical protein
MHISGSSLYLLLRRLLSNMNSGCDIQALSYEELSINVTNIMREFYVEQLKPYSLLYRFPDVQILHHIQITQIYKPTIK